VFFLPYRRRYTADVEEVIRALFAVGVSQRKLAEVLEVLYGAKLSASTISRMAQVGSEEVEKWRRRPLEERYAVIFLDATYFSLRRVRISKEPIYVAIGIREDGRREILGWWLGGSEGESASVWGEILEELKERGVKYVHLFVTDGLKGLKETILRHFPSSKYQRCVMHAVKYTLQRVRVCDRGEVAFMLKRIYRVGGRKESEEALEDFKNRYGRIYPKIVRLWEENFDDLMRFLDFPFEIRRFIYTTNQLERLFKEVKRRLKVMEILPEEENADKILYLIFSDLNERYLRRRLPGFEIVFSQRLQSVAQEVR
jgi:transposase-like protein